MANARLNQAEVKVAAQAKRERWPIVARGSYFVGGETVVRLASPACWRSCYLARDGIVEVSAAAYDATENGPSSSVDLDVRAVGMTSPATARSDNP